MASGRYFLQNRLLQQLKNSKMGVIWSSLAAYGPPAMSLISWRTLAVIFVLANLKSLHFMWFIRFLRVFVRRLTDTAPSKHLSPRCLFLPAISGTRPPALECDYNLHKSNSTYFTDMDMSRINFSLVLFGKPFNPIPGQAHFTIAMGGTMCTWHTEIKPYQPYELWTRVISWDDKWLYIVTHFVKGGVFKPEEYVMQPWRGKEGKLQPKTEEMDIVKAVFASSVARFVFKNNRKTIPPEQALQRVGLLPSDEAELAEVERLRVKRLPTGRLEVGWDTVRSLFEPGPAVLGWYNSAY